MPSTGSSGTPTNSSPRQVGRDIPTPTGCGSTTPAPCTASWTACAPTTPACGSRPARAGGGRVDLGILARTDQAWTSDNTDPVDRIGIQHGFSQLFPAQTVAARVTDSPNTATGRATPLRFRCHVAMAGALGLGGDLTRWSEEELDEAAALVARYKEIRPLVQHG
ncbi:alpha-galactosidase [Streptomyces sp. NPDC001933]|uniref:alpha-galactosidase n=1 Tax=Streptomyces sp. NPDC001933 TaxID=3364626 RepID=UPI0036A454A5